MADVACAIIAGGSARRLGGAVKALLTIDGTPIIERQLAVLRGRVSAIGIAANDPEPYRATGLPVFPDRIVGAGPLAGLEAALGFFRRPYVLALACDMPHFDERLLTLLLSRRGPEVDAVVPMVGGRPEPLCALYARRLLPIVRRRLETGRRAARGLFDEPDVRVAWLSEAELRAQDPTLRALANVNTPEQLATHSRSES